MKTPLKIAAVIVCLSLTGILHAQVPQLINYQGRVVVGTTNFDGSGQFKFALVNAAGAAYWTNDGTHLDGTEPDTAVALPVTKGLYSVLLGDNAIANMTALPGTVFMNADVRLRVWFNDGTHGSQLLTPDQRLGAVGYAFMADNIKDGAITSAKLGNAAVGTANIAPGAVDSAQLASGLTLAGTTTGTFSGPLAGNAATATSAPSFTGSLAGDVTGFQASTVVASVGGVTAANVASGANLANAATNANAANAIVKRDASGNFSAGTISAGVVNIPATTSATNGVIQMAGIPILSAGGGGANIFLGSGAGNFTLTGFQNTGSGWSALHSLTSGNDNTATGAFALFKNTSGIQNSALGISALSNNTSGSRNTATGDGALSNNVTGADNTAGGFGALQQNTASGNTAIGSQALALNTSGTRNTAVGFSALAVSSTGNDNTAHGYQALQSNSGDENTADGSSALANNITGFDNTAGGDLALFSNTTGSENTATGDRALGLNVMGNQNTAQGASALIENTGNGNTADGYHALTNNTTGSNNIGIGINAGQHITTGSNNIDIGNDGAVESNTIRIGTTQTNTFLTGIIHGNGSALTGISSSASFTGSLAGDVTGSQTSTLVAFVNGVAAVNVASGANLANAATTANTPNAIVKRDGSGDFNSTGFTGSLTGDVTGPQGVTNILATVVTGKPLTGFSSTTGTVTASDTVLSAVDKLYGNDALKAPLASPSFTGVINIPATTSASSGVIQMNGTSIISAPGMLNVFLGNGAGNFTLTGTKNMGVGVLAMNQIAGGSFNTAAGEQALNFNTAGDNNTAVGWAALFNATGSNNIGIGKTAGQNITTGTNNIDIGNDGAIESNTIRIGNAGLPMNTYIAGIYGSVASSGTAVFISSDGHLGTVNSSRRFKTDIKPMEDASSVLLSLKPVTFRYKPEIDAEGIPQFGLIAEEVAELCPDLVLRNEKGEIQTVRYEQVNAMLLNEFLKEHRRSAELKQEQESQVAALREENATLRNENAANAKRLATLEARDKERDARLTRIEMSIPPAQPVSNTIAVSETNER